MSADERNSERLSVLFIAGLAVVALVSMFLELCAQTFAEIKGYFVNGFPPGVIEQLTLGGLLVAAVLALLYMFLDAWRSWQNDVRARVAAGPTYILLPRADAADLPFDQIGLLARLRALLPRWEHYSFEINATWREVYIALHASQQVAAALVAEFQTEWPGTQHLCATHPSAEDNLLIPADWPVCIYCVEPRNAAQTLQVEAADPLVGLLGTSGLGYLHGDIFAGMQILVKPDDRTGRNLLKQARDLLDREPQGAGWRATFDRQADALVARAERPFLRAEIRVWVAAPNVERARAEAWRIAEALRACLRGEFAPRVREHRLKPAEAAAVLSERRWLGRGQPWADHELAALLHLPGRATIAAASRLRLAGARDLAPAPELLFPSDAAARAAERIIIGHWQDPTGRTYAIGQSWQNLTLHTSVIGSTGSGKSVWMANVAAELFRDCGIGTCVLEPHHDLCDSLLAAVPDDLLERVVVLDPTSPYPLSLSLFETRDQAYHQAGAEAILDLLLSASPGGWATSTAAQRIVRQAVSVLQAVGLPHTSLVGLRAFLDLGSSKYREYILARAAEANPHAVEDCYRMHRSLATGRGGEVAASVALALDRIDLLISNAPLRRALALPPLRPAVDLDALLSADHLVLAPISATDAVCSRVTATLYMRVLRRMCLARADTRDRHPVGIFVDELAALWDQQLGGLVVEMLGQVRKFNAMVVIGTQYYSQLKPDLQSALQSNVLNKLVLLLAGYDDAREAAAALGDGRASAQDIMTVAPYHGYVRLRGGTRLWPTCSVALPAPLEPATSAPRACPATPGAAPELSPVWTRVHELVVLARGRDAKARAALSACLHGLSDQEWELAVRDQITHQRWEAARLLAELPVGMTRAERARRISAYLHGLPDYFYDAYYLRLDEEFRPHD